MADIQSNINVSIDTSNAVASIKLLQSQISAFQTAMAKSSAANAATASGMQQNLISNINATGKFEASLKTIKTTTESFTTSLEKNKLSLGQYFRYAVASSKSFGSAFQSEFNTINKVARERVKDLQTSYIQMGRDANGAMKAIAIRPLMLDMDSLATKTQIAAQRQQLLNQLLKQGSTNLLNFGKNTQWAGRQLMVGFSIPIAMAGTAAAKAYMQIEEASIKIRRVYGDLSTTSKETNMMVNQIKQLATEYTKYGVAVADTMDMAAKAAAMGKTGQDLLAQVEQATRLSVLGGVDQQQALDTTISLTNSFGIAAEQLTGKINFLNAVENQTVTSIEDLTIAVPKAGPVIEQLGGSVEDLTFFLTAMREGGINASEGANALKSGLAALINPTKKASDFLAGFGINVKQIVESDKGNLKKTVVDFASALNTLDPLNRARAIEQMFGKFQFARISTLFKNITTEGSQASKAAALANMSSIQLAAMSERELKKLESSPMYKFQKTLADLQTKIAPIGETFLKAVTPVLEGVGKVLDGINGMGDGFKQFLVVGTAVVGGLAPVLLMLVGLVANGAANIIKLFANIKSFFNRANTSSQILGETTNYLTTEQIKAEAVAASLDQVHTKLTQTFTSEAAAIGLVTAALERQVAAQAMAMPAAGLPGVAPRRKATGGYISGPGTGTSDSIPILASNGEFIVPAKQTKKFLPILQGIVSGRLPGFNGENGNIVGGMSATQISELKRSSGLFKAPSAVRTQTVNMDWVTRIAEVAAAEAAGRASLMASGATDETKISKQLGNLGSKQASHIMPDTSNVNVGGIFVQVKNWLAENLVPDLGYVNNYLNAIQSSATILDNFNNTHIDRVAQELGMSVEDVAAEVNNFRQGIHPTTRAGASVLQKIAETDTGYQGAAASAGLKQRLAGDYYETMDQRKYNPAKDVSAANTTMSRLKLFGRKVFGTGKQSLPENTENIIIDATTNKIKAIDDVIVEAARKQTNTKSPSVEASKVGQDIGQGFIDGGKTKIKEAAVIGKQLASATTGTTQSGGQRRARLSAGQVIDGMHYGVGTTPVSYSGQSYGAKDKLSNRIRTGYNKVKTGKVALSGSKVSGIGFGASMALGAASMIPGPIGQMAGTLSPIVGIISMFGGAISKILPTLLRFAGPIGIAVTVLGGLVAISGMLADAKKKELEKTNAAADAASAMAGSLDGLAKTVGVRASNPMLIASEAAQKGINNPTQVNDVNTLLESTDFTTKGKGGQKTTKDFIDKLKLIDSKETVKALLDTTAQGLLARGATDKVVEDTVMAIKVAAGKQDIQFDVKSIKLGTKAGDAGLKTTISSFLSSINKLQKDVPMITKTTGAGLINSVTTTTQEMDKTSKEFKSLTADAQTLGTILGQSILNVGQLFASGKISAEQYDKTLANINESFNKLGKDAKQIAIVKMFDGVPEAQRKVADGINSVTDKMKYLQIVSMGGAVSESIISGLNSADARVQGRAKTQLAKLANKYKAASKEIYAAMKSIYGEDAPGGGGGGSTKTTPLQDLQEQLKQAQALRLLMSKGQTTGFSEMLSGLSKEDRAKYLQNGKLTSKGNELKDTYNTKVLTDFGNAQTKLVRGFAEEQTTKDALIGANVNYLVAVKASTDADVKAAVAAALNIKDQKKRKAALDEIAAALGRVDTAQKKADWAKQRDAQIEATKNASNQAIAYKKLVDAGMSVAVAYETIQDAALAASIAGEASIQQIQAYIVAARKIAILVEKFKDPNQRIVDNAQKQIDVYQAQATTYQDALTILQAKETKINETYDKRIEALDKVLAANQAISQQQQGQLDLADALSRGDIAAAAKSAADMRAQTAVSAVETQKKLLGEAKDAQVKALTIVVGSQTLTMKDLTDKIAALESQMSNIKLNTIDPAAQALANQANANVITDSELANTTAEYTPPTPAPAEIQAPAGKTAAQLAAEKAAADKAAAAKAKAAAAAAAAKAAANAAAAKAKAAAAAAAAKATAAAKSAALQKRMSLNPNLKYASTGGVVPQYLAGGGVSFRPRGTDVTPAMLTPGEFVIRKSAVDSFGTNNLRSINNGTYDGSSVYNYDININVRSESNANDIASTVMQQIQRIDNQRLKGNRLNAN